MRRFSGRLVIAAAFVAGLVASGGSAAIAATVSSSVGDLGVHSGFHYYNRAEALNTSDAGYTTTWVSGTKNAATGWIGSEGRLFTSSGALCRTSGMKYADGPAVSLTIPAVKGSCAAGYFYSYGKSATWNGNGYGYYYTFRTPNIYMS